jgi:hypothetical protein
VAEGNTVGRANPQPSAETEGSWMFLIS